MAAEPSGPQDGVCLKIWASSDVEGLDGEAFDQLLHALHLSSQDVVELAAGLGLLWQVATSE